MIWEDDFALRTVPFLNLSRIYVSQYHISHLYKKCLEENFMLAIFLNDVIVMLAFNLYSRTSKEVSMGDLVDGNYEPFCHHQNTVNILISKGNQA